MRRVARMKADKGILRADRRAAIGKRLDRFDLQTGATQHRVQHALHFLVEQIHRRQHAEPDRRGKQREVAAQDGARDRHSLDPLRAMDASRAATDRRFQGLALP
jgi:hypothetical protein